MQEIPWYSPDEDSYTLVDVIEQEHIRNSVILDLGTSTGYITKSCHPSNIIIGSDLNRSALVEQKTGNLIRMDLLKCIRQDLIDVIIFNPPYVVDSTCAIIGGGENGRRVIDQFIREVTCKKFYLLVILANNPELIIKRLEDKGYEVSILKTRRILGETILILKGVKSHKV